MRGGRGAGSPELSPEQAVELARQAALGADQFEWYTVSTAVYRAGIEGAGLAMRVVSSA